MRHWARELVGAGYWEGGAQILAHLIWWMAGTLLMYSSARHGAWEYLRQAM